jgi:hypothetical protein
MLPSADQRLRMRIRYHKQLVLAFLIAALCGLESSAQVPPCPPSDGTKPTPHGRFSEDPGAVWLTEKGSDRKMCLLEGFRFIDPAGKPWETPKHYVVDGASIPRPLWSLVGSPYTGEYRRASVVHDKACDDAGSNAKKRREADKMFFHACRAGGSSKREAIILYVGVRIGALASHIGVWRVALAHDMEEARTEFSAAEERLLADFRLIAERVLQAGETDDPDELEKRTDEVMIAITGVDVREY